MIISNTNRSLCEEVCNIVLLKQGAPLVLLVTENPCNGCGVPECLAGHCPSFSILLAIALGPCLVDIGHRYIAQALLVQHSRPRCHPAPFAILRNGARFHLGLIGRELLVAFGGDRPLGVWVQTGWTPVLWKTPVLPGLRVPLSLFHLVCLHSCHFLTPESPSIASCRTFPGGFQGAPILEVELQGVGEYHDLPDILVNPG